MAKNKYNEEQEKESKSIVVTEESKEKAKKASKGIRPKELTDDKVKELTKQFEVERKYASEYFEPWLNEQERRLKLYNNQKRDKKMVGDPLLFTIMDTILSSLFEDKMNVKFIAREPGDVKYQENINNLAAFDYDEMGKADIDYVRIWDTLFFSYSMVDMNGFDWVDQTPVPYVWDPLTSYYDPSAASLDGDKKGRGAARFVGHEFTLTKRQLKEDKNYFDTDLLKPSTTNSSDRATNLQNARAEAQGTQPDNDRNPLIGDNEEYRLVEHRTWIDGKRCLLVFGDEGKILVRYQVLKDQTSWSIALTRIWITPGQLRGTSVPDLTEDKQRLKAILLNTGVRSLKQAMYPNYAYNRNLIYNKQDLLRAGYNKYIPVKDNPNNVIAPIKQQSVELAVYNYLMQEVDTSAQKATATPDIQQGAKAKGQKTLGELEIQQSNVDTRYSKLVKGILAGEKSFWTLWLRGYKLYFPEHIGEKIMRMGGLGSPIFRPIVKEDIAFSKDPDIYVESAYLNEQAQTRRFSKLVSIAQMLAQDPEADRRYMQKLIVNSAGLTTQEVDGVYPPTLDEDIAQKENTMLNENKMVQIRKTDNHRVHIRNHIEANATPATLSHIESHRKAMLMQVQNPELFPEMQQNQAGQQGLQPGEKGTVDTQGIVKNTTDQLRSQGNYSAPM